MKTTGRIAYVLTPVLLSSILTGCGRNDTNATAAIASPGATPPNSVSNSAPIAPTSAIAQQSGVTRDLGPIDFAPGATAASVSNSIDPNSVDRYTFDASAGQPTNLRVTSPGGQVLLTLVDPNGNPIVRYQSGASSWAGTLPATGTYRVDVFNPSDGSPYSVGLNITP